MSSYHLWIRKIQTSKGAGCDGVLRFYRSCLIFSFSQQISFSHQTWLIFYRKLVAKCSYFVRNGSNFYMAVIHAFLIRRLQNFSFRQLDLQRKNLEVWVWLGPSQLASCKWVGLGWDSRSPKNGSAVILGGHEPAHASWEGTTPSLGSDGLLRWTSSEVWKLTSLSRSLVHGLFLVKRLPFKRIIKLHHLLNILLMVQKSC